jgi:hypothetical protein
MDMDRKMEDVLTYMWKTKMSVFKRKEETYLEAGRKEEAK